MESTCLPNVNILPPNKTSDLYSTTLSLQVEDNKTKKDKTEEVKKCKTLIAVLLERLPVIGQFFSVHKKVGEGTFSNVFVATTKATIAEKKKFAIKHLTSTSHPSRIIQEIKCLQDIGGKDNVVGLELCFRNRDSVAFVMPYFSHDSFSNYVTEMTPQETQLYMKNLLIALQRVHSFNVIHRDVKPGNFLYNRKEQKFLLVDFGLSQKCENIKTSNNVMIFKNDRKRVLDPFESDTCSPELKRPVLHSLSNNVPETNNDRYGIKQIYKKRSPLFKENSPLSKNTTFTRNINQVKRNLQFGNLTAEAKKDVFPVIEDKLYNSLEIGVASSLMFNKAGSSFFRIQNSQIKSQFSIGNGPMFKSNSFRKPLIKSYHSLPKECNCDMKPKICNNCITRKPMYAARAGTPGYRSPEVLLKYPYQTTAVDIWSAGVIMLSILSGSYPFFCAPDDISALMEMITIFGTDEFKSTAKKLGRNLLCNENRKALSLSKLCERLRKRTATAMVDTSEITVCNSCKQKILPNEGCLCYDCVVDIIPSEDISKQIFPNEAYDLLSKLLAVDPEKRYTAKDALNHPFFKMNLEKSD